MKRILLILIAAVAVCGILPACANKKLDDTSPISMASINQTTDALVTVKETTAAPTITPTDAPSVSYTFDLTQNEDKEPEYQLAFLSNADGAVIFGGENSPYYVKGSFYYSDVDSMWSPMTSFTFHLTEAVNNYAYSLDKTSLAFLVNKEGVEGTALTYFDGSEAYEIAPCSGYFCISSDGSAVAYISNGDLFVWDYIAKESTLITDDASGSFVLSPEGSYISYSKGADYTCYIAPVGGAAAGAEAVQIGSYCFPAAITEDGSTVYYYDDSGDHTAFCAYSPGGSQGGSPGGSQGGSQGGSPGGSQGSSQVLDEAAVVEKTEYMYTADLIFNRDCTQVVFRSGSDYYFSMNGGKPVRAAGGHVVDTNPKLYANDAFVRLMNVKGQTISPYFTDSKNLCNLLFKDGTALTFFDENLEVYSFPVGEYGEGYLSEGGKALIYYTYDLDVRTDPFTYTYISDFSDPDSRQIVLEDHYIWTALLTAGDNIYYRNDIAQMYMIRGEGVPVKIDTYVYDVNSMMVGDRSYIYYLKDPLEDYSYTLCCIEDIPGAVPVVIDSGVYNMDICDAGLVYYKNKTYSLPDFTTDDIYFSADGLQSEYIFTLVSGMN